MESKEYQNIFNLEKSHWWYKGLHHLVRKVVLQQLRFSKDNTLRILDIGCGTGGMLNFVQDLGKVEGFDFSKEAIDFCQINQLENVYQEDFNLWTPEKEKYDVIICLDILCQKQIKSDLVSLEKIYTALKSGGIVIINLPAFNCLKRQHDIFVHASRRYEIPYLKEMVKNVGFNNSRISYRLPIAYLFLRVLIPFKKNKPIKSDIRLLPKVINSVLLGFIKLENFVILKGIRVPFGSSVFLVSRK